MYLQKGEGGKEACEKGNASRGLAEGEEEVKGERRRGGDWEREGGSRFNKRKYKKKMRRGMEEGLEKLEGKVG